MPVVVNEVVTRPTVIDNTKVYALHTIPSDRIGKVTKFKVRNYGNGADLIIRFYQGIEDKPEYVLAEFIIPNNTEQIIDFPIYFEEVIGAKSDALPGTTPTAYNLMVQLVVEELK